eukprot:3479422-Prymnesium_polylepis.1
MVQLEHFCVTTAALRLATAHTGTRAAPTATAAVVVRQPALTVSVLVSSKAAAPGRTCTSAAARY